MPLRYTSGDMFSVPADAIVNTVNCVGVMGKGVALEFKHRWPQNFKAYKKLCDAKELAPGKMFIYDAGDMFAKQTHRYLINFPTKLHWRAKSKLSYIEEGLDDFVTQVRHFKIKSVVMPPLGCGNGGLPWPEVRALLEQKLSDIDGVEFVVFVPNDYVHTPEFRDIPKKMTWERAVLVHTIGEMEKYFGGHLTRISLHKVTYFLQAMGVDFGLTFTRNTHGPYSEALKTALTNMEKLNYLVGFSKDPAEIRATQGAFTLAEEYLAKDSFARHDEIVRQMELLIEGYESPYGMELLSSVHYLVAHEGIRNVEDIISAIHKWNDHKHNHFQPDAIKMAYHRLVEDGLIHSHA